MRVSSSGASRRPAQRLTFILGSPQAGTDTFLDHRALKLGEDSHHLEKRLAGWRRRVDTLGLEEQIIFQGSIWKSALPAGVVVSIPWVLRNRSFFKEAGILRPRRSTD
jgi:hypothetical protein